MCSRSTPGSLPRSLIDRPLHFPVVRTGAACPVDTGVQVQNSSYGGVGFGHGPVQLVVAQNSGDLLHGRVTVGPSDTTGWLAFKSLWVVAPSYQGPLLVRARRIDGPGRVAMLSGAVPGPLVVPPGRTINDYSGTRTAPVGTYVSGPGCVAFQIDGKGFAESIVVSAVAGAGG